MSRADDCEECNCARATALLPQVWITHDGSGEPTGAFTTETFAWQYVAANPTGGSGVYPPFKLDDPDA